MHNIKQHWQLCWKQSQSGLVSSKTCKNEAKTIAKVFGKVDTFETYQYSRLRTSLKRANILFAIEMHMEEHPDYDVGDQEILDHYARRQKCCVVRNVMI